MSSYRRSRSGCFLERSLVLFLLAILPTVNASRADDAAARNVEGEEAPAEDDRTDDDVMLEEGAEDDAEDLFNGRFFGKNRSGPATIDDWVFGATHPETVEAAQIRFEATVSQQIEKLCGFCELNEAQVRKLRLAARGDVEHLYRQIRELRESCSWKSRDEIEPEEYSNAWKAARSLRLLVESGPFGPKSLFVKTIASTLTPRQFALYSTMGMIRGLGGRVRRPKGKLDGPPEIDLRGTEVSDDALEFLAVLHEADSLNLEATSVSDAGLRHIQPLTNLRRLDLAHTDVSDSGIVQLKCFPKLESLNLGNTKIADAALEELNDLTGLRNLRLFATRVTDTGTKHLESLNRLEFLNLSQTQISDETLPTVSKLTGLKELGLYGTRVTDAGLVHLQNLKDLRVLDLRFTPVSDVGLSQLKRLSELRELYLQETQVTGPGVAELEAAISGLIVIR